MGLSAVHVMRPTSQRQHPPCEQEGANRRREQSIAGTFWTCVGMLVFTEPQQ